MGTTETMTEGQRQTYAARLGNRKARIRRHAKQYAEDLALIGYSVTDPTLLEVENVAHGCDESWKEERCDKMGGNIVWSSILRTVVESRSGRIYDEYTFPGIPTIYDVYRTDQLYDLICSHASDVRA